MMNILGINANKLNELVFEHRNKSYGAYDIRQHYNSTICKALLSIGVLLGILYISTFVYNKYNALVETPKPLLIDDLKPEPIIYETKIDLTPNQPTHTPEQHVEASVAPPSNMVTQIIDETTQTQSTTPIDNPVNGNGSNMATGNSATGTETGTLNVGTSQTASTPNTSNTEYVIVQDMPEFEGGNAALLSFVAKNIVYPTLAREIGQEGTVFVSFVVNENGMVEGAKILKGIGYGCDEEVLRVINKLPKWKKVGRQDGKPVKVRFNIPVAFKLK